jgi:hypothetical protein
MDIAVPKSELKTTLDTELLINTSPFQISLRLQRIKRRNLPLLALTSIFKSSIWRRITTERKLRIHSVWIEGNRLMPTLPMSCQALRQTSTSSNNIVQVCVSIFWRTII